MRVISLVVVVLGLVLANALVDATLVNEDVSRVIDLKSHLVRVVTKVTLKNTGEKSLSRFQFDVDPKHAGNLAHILFTQGSDNEHQLKAVKSKNGNSYTVSLLKTLLSEGTTSYSVEEVYTNTLTPFPKEITQSQNQLVVYEGNHFFYSPYMSQSQSTTVELPSSTVESFSKFGGAEKSDTTIKYADADEFDNVAAGSQNAMKIHFENNNPFVIVTKLERVVEVSHWGNIAVEETLDIAHNGAKLKGSFSRYDYQRQPNSGAASVKSFKTILPSSAQDVYYRDEIGNISTSNLFQNEESVDLEIRPRFPLFGGWKTHYYIGYNLPSYNYLYTKGDNLALKMRVVDHVMENQLIEDLTLKIILPEGCKNIQVELPYDNLDRDVDGLHYTYLDTAGRPVLTFHGKNLVDQHIEEFTLSYTFNRALLLQEPALIICAFFLLFLTVIIAVRLDFSIAQDSVLETRMRLQGVMDQVRAHQAKRDGCYKAYQAALASYKASKDSSSWASSRKSIDKDHKEATTSITTLLDKMREDSNEAAEKESSYNEASNKQQQQQKKRGQDKKVMKRGNEISNSSYDGRRRLTNIQACCISLRKEKKLLVQQLNKVDMEVKDKFSSLFHLTERLIGEKISRDSYADQSNKIDASISDLTSKIDHISDLL